MFCPGAHAHPTELVLAFLARHVAVRNGKRREHSGYTTKGGDSLAAAVLLNSALTFATLLRVTLDPVCRLAVVLALLKPHLCNATNDRSVVCVHVAAEAEPV